MSCPAASPPEMMTFARSVSRQLSPVTSRHGLEQLTSEGWRSPSSGPRPAAKCRCPLSKRPEPNDNGAHGERHMRRTHQHTCTEFEGVPPRQFVPCTRGTSTPSSGQTIPTSWPSHSGLLPAEHTPLRFLAVGAHSAPLPRGGISHRKSAKSQSRFRMGSFIKLTSN